MKNRSFKYIFSLMLLSALLIVGCGSGGSQSVLKQESPETAVMRISESWRGSVPSPSVIVDNNNKFIRQATDQDTNSNTTSNSSGKVIYLKDLAGGDPYELKVTDVKKADNTAEVTCKFYYNNGTLVIVFKLIFEDDKWWLDDVEIKEEELGENEAYLYIYHIGPDGKELYNEPDQKKGTIGSTVYAKDYIIDDTNDPNYNLYEYKSALEDSITIGSSDNKLTLYYMRRTAVYTVYYYFYDENGKLNDSMTQIFTGTGNVGDDIDISKITYKIPDGYEKTKEPESLVINRDKDSNKFEYSYKLNKKQEEEDKYTITGVISDSKGKVANATIKFFKVNKETGKAEACENNGQEIELTTDSNGEYSTSSLNYEFTDGDYLLVVYKDGYESQTIKVTLPLTDTAQNFRANITLK